MIELGKLAFAISTALVNQQVILRELAVFNPGGEVVFNERYEAADVALKMLAGEQHETDREGR